MGRFTEAFESGDFDPGQLGATVQYVLDGANRKIGREERKKYELHLEMANDAAHWVLEKNNGVGMPPGVPEKIIKLYDERHKKSR